MFSKANPILKSSWLFSPIKQIILFWPESPNPKVSWLLNLLCSRLLSLVRIKLQEQKRAI